MSYTKRQFVVEAYTELGMADYIFDLQPEQLVGACRRLDAMMAEWNGRGIQLNYILPTSPENTNLDDETNVPDWANEAVFLNLAVKLAPMHGKMVSPDTRASAKMAFSTAQARTSKDVEMQLPDGVPLGAGYKRITEPFTDVPDDPNFIEEPEDLIFETP